MRLLRLYDKILSNGMMTMLPTCCGVPNVPNIPLVGHLISYGGITIQLFKQRRWLRPLKFWNIVGEGCNRKLKKMIATRLRSYMQIR